MPEDDIQFLLKWHYGDDTTDGSGIDHYDYEELRYRYRHEIKKFNFDLLEKMEIFTVRQCWEPLADRSGT